MSINSFREKINLALYESKESVLNLFTFGSFATSFFVLCLFVYQFGFSPEDNTRAWIFLAVKGSFVFYILKYITNIIYCYEPILFIKESWLEFLLLCMIVINSFWSFLMNQSLLDLIGSKLNLLHLDSFYSVFIQSYFFILVGIELGKASPKIIGIRLTPPQLMISSFILLILIGTGLLMMPEMTYRTNPISWFDAFFTSISATCVTGLIIHDTATFFTQKGHIILMLLIQLGGLNIISFATLFTVFSRKGLGIKHQSIIHENSSADSLFSSKGLVRKIFFLSLFIEIIGGILLYFNWNQSPGSEQLKDPLFYSIFHSISAFNNAGFSLFTEGMNSPALQSSFNIHIIIAVLVFFGGIGFPVISEIFNRKRILKSLKSVRKSLKLSTRISFYTSLFLVAFGACMFYFLEQGNSLNGMSMKGQLVTSLFQSISARTAGFNTVDFSSIGIPMLIIFIFLMFIGASPGSTGGGIKTSTFTLIIYSAINTIRGNKKIEIGERSISSDLLQKAFSIFLFSMISVFISIFILSISDGNLGIMAIIFETVSAFSTVGLTTGITPELSFVGKIVIMICMFVGRIGTLTLAFAISTKVKTNNYQYPKAHITIG
ncbi:MAG: ATPase [Flavobacteriales bacterium]|nr:ATPase [Flavobacteriales bacterium]|tara:strand:+ start:1147 stop:2958 length:1812 start_codon:yes stop_codon:yes gene_type:complete